jgi:hypothetical protein
VPCLPLLHSESPALRDQLRVALGETTTTTGDRLEQRAEEEAKEDLEIGIFRAEGVDLLLLSISL